MSQKVEVPLKEAGMSPGALLFRESRSLSLGPGGGIGTPKRQCPADPEAEPGKVSLEASGGMFRPFPRSAPLCPRSPGTLTAPSRQAPPARPPPGVQPPTPLASGPPLHGEHTGDAAEILLQRPRSCTQDVPKDRSAKLLKLGPGSIFILFFQTGGKKRLRASNVPEWPGHLGT